MEPKFDDRPTQNYIVTDASGRRGIVKEDPNSYVNSLLLNPKPAKSSKRTKYYINDD
jgi:hypothetical protein